MTELLLTEREARAFDREMKAYLYARQRARQLRDDKLAREVRALRGEA